MSGHRVHQDLAMAASAGQSQLTDPGNGATVQLKGSYCVLPLTIAAAGETRVLPTSATAGLHPGMVVHVVVDQITGSGYCTIEGTLFNTEGQTATLLAAMVNGSVVWTTIAGSNLSADDLTLNSTNEMNFQIGNVGALALDDAAIASNAAAAATAGLNVFVETQDGGTAATDGDGQDGGNFTLTAGVASSATNDHNGADSGTISFVTQAGTALIGGGTINGKNGVIRLNTNSGYGGIFTKQAAPAAKTTAVTLTAAEVSNGIITGTHSAGATAAYTLPTGANLDLFVHDQVGTDEAFDWTLINLSAAAIDTITLTANTNHTIVGNPIVQSAHSSTGGIYGNSARFRTRRTAANTYITYRVG